MSSRANKILLCVCAVLMVVAVALSVTLIMMTALSPDIHLFDSSAESEETSDRGEGGSTEDALPVGKGDGSGGSTHTGKRVAITFDDGPSYIPSLDVEYTKEILDELKKYGYTATFFVVGNRLASHGDALEYIVDAGCEIGIHGYTHDEGVWYDTCTDGKFADELSLTVDAIHEYLPDYDVKLMRPYYGRITDERVKNCDYAVINWSVDSEDWVNKYKSGDTDKDTERKINTIVENVMSTVENGDIILMHDIYGNTVEATRIILARLHEEGYEVVTVSELLGNPKAGVMYSHN